VDGKRTLLIVDDDVDVLDTLRDTFVDQYEVLTTSSPWAAIEMLRTHTIDLMITDQRMPQMTGVELARRALVDTPQVSCIILTGYTSPLDLVQALHLENVYRCVTKPWDVGELKQTVADALARKSDR
jgi:DNA-binding NtrC family response regulator